MQVKKIKCKSAWERGREREWKRDTLFAVSVARDGRGKSLKFGVK